MSDSVIVGFLTVGFPVYSLFRSAPLLSLFGRGAVLSPSDGPSELTGVAAIFAEHSPV